MEVFHIVRKSFLTWAELVLTVLLIVIFFGGVHSMGESAARLSIQASAAEIASVASAMQVAPDGASYEFTLPKKSRCTLRIFEGFVELKSGAANATASIMAVNGEHAVERWTQKEDCSEKPRLVFRKENGIVIVEPAEEV